MNSNVEHERLLAAMFGEDNPFTEFLLTVARDLSALRQSAGLSQRALAERMNTQQMQVWKLEQGDQIGVQLRSLYAYADACGYDTQVIFLPRGQR